MKSETPFLEALETEPENDAHWLVYADWLEERGDVRSGFVRCYLATRYLTVDHPCWFEIEEELSLLRPQCDSTWLNRVLNIRAVELTQSGVTCGCFRSNEGTKQKRITTQLHNDIVDTQDENWRALNNAIEQARRDTELEFSPLDSLKLESRGEVASLPKSIGRLTSVKALNILASGLSRVPPEIGDMTELEVFFPYMSYRLHWFPFEITRCKKLQNSGISTRALYGNYKFRWHFPELAPWRKRASREFLDLYESRWHSNAVRACSVCRRDFNDEQLFRFWISLRVATDVMPLLVNACSQSCIDSLPSGADKYVPHPHRGGPEIQQPPDYF